MHCASCKLDGEVFFQRGKARAQEQELRISEF